MQHRKPVFAANWKMNHGPTDARAFMSRFLALTARQQDRMIIFFPSALTLAAVAEAVKERPDMLIGVQNVHTDVQGAFTGENSVLMARDAGARVVLVGHSERRHVFGETDEETAKKCALVAQSRLIPMLCVGETLAERESGATAAVVERQLAAGISGLDEAQISSMMLAYEPVWAIAAELLRSALASTARTGDFSGLPSNGFRSAPFEFQMRRFRPTSRPVALPPIVLRYSCTRFCSSS